MKNLTKILFHFLLTGLILLPLSCTRTIIEPISPEGSTKVFGKPVFADNLYYFPKEALKNIKSYQNNRLVLTDLSGVINANETVNAGGRVEAHEIIVGDYLVSEPAPNAPQGFLWRVKSIVKSGADYVIETVDAAFDEVFKDVNAKDEHTISIPYTLPENTKISLKATNNTGASASIEVSLTGSVNYYMTLGYEIKTQNYELEKAAFTLATRSDHNIKIKSPKAVFGGEIEAPRLYLKDFSFPIRFLIGPVPVVITVVGALYAKVSMNGQVTVEAEINKKSTSVVGGVYEKGKDWQKVEIPDKEEGGINPIVLKIEGGVKAGIYAGVTVKFYEGGVAIYGDIGVFGKLDGKCVNSKSETNPSIGVEITGGIALVKFTKNPSKLSLNFEIPISEKKYSPIISEYDCDSITIPTVSTPTVFYEGGKSSGDPNIITFDGKSYSFNGVGEFIATKSSTDNFEIQVRQEELKNRNSSGSVSWSTGLAMNTGSDKLCFYPNKYYINQTPYNYSSSINNTLSNGGSITGNTQTFVVNTGNGDIIKIFNRNDALDYSIIPNSQRQGKMIGIFGNYDGQSTNDLLIRNGSQIDGSYGTLYPNFTNSWRIAQNQSLFVYDVGKNTDTYSDISFPRTPLVITASQRANATQVCKNAGVVAPFLEGCIVDVVATGDNSMADRSKNLQDERTLKNFDIKFGPNDDKSLLSNRINGNLYGADYLLCDGIFPIIDRPIYVINGFETTIYFASEKPDPRTSILSSSLKFNLTGGFDWSISGGQGYNFYDPLLNLQKSIDPTIFIFDGKLHKVVIQSTINTSTRISTYRLLFDDILVLENKDFIIRTYNNLQNNLLGNTGVSLTFGASSGAPKVKLYRWSFKSF